MDTNKLYLELKKAYIEENLNKITRKIVNSYRNKEIELIQYLINKISTFLNISDSESSKAFSRLILLYHPDKLKYYQNHIEQYYNSNDTIKLNQLAHIFVTLNNLDYNPRHKTIGQIKPVARPEDYGYAVDLNEFDHIVEFEPFEQEIISEDSSFDFISALIMKEFGSPDFKLQTYHLESLIGDLNFIRNRINDLTGIEHCTNISTLDFSDNEIVEITNLGFLVLLEEVYLSNNEIYSVDSLSNLYNLRILDLSFNNIEDISPLFELSKLVYLNLIGNSIPQEQIEKVSTSGRLVVF